MSTRPRLLIRLALVALLAPAATLCAEPSAAAPLPAAPAPPAAPAAARPAAPAPPPIPVVKGSVLRVDRSRVPQRVAQRGTATCGATRTDATGALQTLECQRPFTFEGPFTADPLVLVFQPDGGGKPTRLEYALEWDPRPRTFSAPSAGVLLRPRPEARPPAGPGPIPPAVLDRAREAGGVACGGCPAPPRYTLRDVKIEQSEAPNAAVELTVQPPGAAP